MSAREGKCPQHGPYVSYCDPCANESQRQQNLGERAKKIAAAKKGKKI